MTDLLGTGGGGGNNKQDTQVGQIFGWSGPYDPQIPTAKAAVVNVPAVQAHITKIGPKGIDIFVNGKTQHVTQLNGKPVVTQVVDKTKRQVTGVDRTGKPTYQDVPDKSHWVIDPSVLGTPDKNNNILWSPASTHPGDPPIRNGSDTLKDYALMAKSSDPNQRAKFQAMQDSLVKIGFLKPGSYIKGLPDDATQAGLQAALLMVDRLNNHDPKTGFTLDDLFNDPTAQKAAPKATLTNPEQIKSLVQAVAPSVLGRPAPDEAVNAITGHLHDLQNQAFDQQLSGNQVQTTTDDVTAAPSGNSAWFAEQLKELMPNAYQANNMFNDVTALQKQLGTKTSPLGNLAVTG